MLSRKTTYGCSKSASESAEGHVAAAQVVEVPGDHFSLLRQDAADMSVLIAALKAALAPHGWSEKTSVDRKPYTMTKVPTGLESL